MKSVLITGAAGFIGFHAMAKLKRNYGVSGIDSLDPEQKASALRMQFATDIVQQDIHDAFLDNLQQKPDVVLHLAADTGIAGSLVYPEKYLKNNVAGTFNVLEQCRKNGVKYLIYASSSSVYSPHQSVMKEDSPHAHQLSFYGTTKRMCELMVENYCRQFGIVAIGLRFFTVYGSWTRPDMAAYKFMSSIENQKAVTLYNGGDVLRDFTHVSDIVNSIELLIDKIGKEAPGTHRIFNIGYGNPVSVRKYAELIAENLGKPLVFEDKDLPESELARTHSDSFQLEEYIRYKPKVSIETGIREMTDWFKSHRYE